MKSAILLVMSLIIAGCASQKVIIDRDGVDMAQYQRDLDACNAYAEEVDSGKKVAGGAVGGALVGAAIGAIIGDSKTAARGAGVGGVSGAARGGGRAANEKSRVVKNCLRGRGYQVLN